MNNDISSLLNKVKSDWFTDFINNFSFEINAFDVWINHSERILENHIIGDFEIIYIANGNVEVTMENNIYTCGANNILIIQPFKFYSVKCLNDDVKYYYIHFDINPVYLHKKFIDTFIGQSGGIYYNDSNIDILSLLTFLEKEMENKSLGYYELIKLTLIELLIYVLRLKEQNFKINIPVYEKNYSKEVDLVNKCADIIKDNINHPIKISDISKELNFSENYIYKAFIKVLNMPPSKYIQLYKIKQAEQLLKTTNMTLEEIAYKLGFSSMFHLSATFKKFFGVSPKQYKKNMKYNQQ